MEDMIKDPPVNYTIPLHKYTRMLFHQKGLSEFPLLSRELKLRLKD